MDGLELACMGHGVLYDMILLRILARHRTMGMDLFHGFKSNQPCWVI